MSFPRYPEYRDSGVEWLGEVPRHWNVQKVRRCLTDHKQGYYPSAYSDAGVKLARISDIDMYGRLSFDNCPFVDDTDEVNDFVLCDGDFVFARTGGAGLFGIVVDISDRVAFASYLIRFRFSVGYYSQFLFYYFLSEAFQGGLKANIHGGVNQNVHAEDIKDQRLAVPPMSEQITIATFLDRHTNKIDALVAEQERLIALLMEKRQAVISHAVTKGLNPDAPMKDSGIEWLGEVPAHWTVVRLKFLAHVQGGVAKGRDLSDADTIEVPYLRVANVQDGYLDLDDVATIQIASHELQRYSLQPGDVLMNEGGDYDKLGRGHIWRGEIETCIHQNHVFAVRPHGIEPEWLNLLTSAECGRFYFMSRSKQSTNLASISSTNIHEFPMPCPPTAERRSIAEYVRGKTSELDTLTVEAQRAIDLLKERRSALISAAVTGKIDVRGLADTEAA